MHPVQSDRSRQFSRLFGLVTLKFSPILRMALTDIWVLLSPSAEHFYNALRRFLTLFRACLCAESSRGEKSARPAPSHSALFVNNSPQLGAELQALSESCIDLLHNCQRVSAETNKAAQLLALLTFLVFGMGHEDAVSSAELAEVPPMNSQNARFEILLDKAFYTSSLTINSSMLYYMAAECFYQPMNILRAQEDSSDDEVESDDEVSGQSSDPALSCATECAQSLLETLMVYARIMLHKVEECTPDLEYQFVRMFRAFQRCDEVDEVGDRP